MASGDTHFMTPCDAYAKWLESHQAAALDIYAVHILLRHCFPLSPPKMF